MLKNAEIPDKGFRKQTLGPLTIFYCCLAFSLAFASCAYAENDWFEIGLKALKQQQYDAAINALTMAVEVMPHDFEAYNNRGVAWFGKGDFRRAIADFSKAVQIYPDFAEGFCNRAIARFHTRLWKATIDDANKALAITPNFFEALCARAAAWTKLKKYQMAVDDYTMAYGRKTAVATKASRPMENGESSPIESRSSLSKRQHSDRVVVLQLLNREIREQGIFVHIQNLKAAAKAATSPKAPAVAKVDAPPKAPPVLKKPQPLSLKKEKPSPPKKPKLLPAKKLKVKKRPFTIHVSSFKNAAKSLAVSRDLKQKKNPAVTTPVIIPGRGTWYRVLVGFYESRSEADLAAARLKKRKFAYARVMKYPWAIAIDSSKTESEQKNLNAILDQVGFSTYDVSGASTAALARVLAGAFKTEKEAAVFVQRLQELGIKAETTRR